VIRRFKAHARKFITLLLKERLDPGRAAAAVFLGIFIGIVPIYGLQTLAAVGAALLFRLNKPLTVAGTFINNPLLQPFIIFSSVELGCLWLWVSWSAASAASSLRLWCIFIARRLPIRRCGSASAL
jgi:uncharacterized protein (DUF2062 family)